MIGVGKKRSNVVNIYIPNSDLPIFEKFVEIIRREGRSLSEVFREFVKEYVKRHESGNPQAKITRFVEIPDLPALPTVPSRYEVEDWLKFREDELIEIAASYKVAIARIERALMIKRGLEGHPCSRCPFLDPVTGYCRRFGVNSRLVTSCPYRTNTS